MNVVFFLVGISGGELERFWSEFALFSTYNVKAFTGLALFAFLIAIICIDRAGVGMEMPVPVPEKSEAEEDVPTEISSGSLPEIDLARLDPNLRKIGAGIEVEGMPPIALLALDNSGEVVVIEMAREESEELLENGLGHLRWVEEKFYPRETQGLGISPRIFFLLPHFSENFKKKVARVEKVSMRLYQYGYFRENKRTGLSFREVMAVPQGERRGSRDNFKLEIAKEIFQQELVKQEQS